MILRIVCSLWGDMIWGGVFMKKVVAVNAGPRKGWNTDALIDEACKGEKNRAHCVIKDGFSFAVRGSL